LIRLKLKVDKLTTVKNTNKQNDNDDGTIAHGSHNGVIIIKQLDFMRVELIKIILEKEQDQSTA